jgi:hypothetical protein
MHEETHKGRAPVSARQGRGHGAVHELVRPRMKEYQENEGRVQGISPLVCGTWHVYRIDVAKVF